MALRKLLFKPGINREKTDYSSEGAWYDCDKVRFRQGFPEKIGGWQRISNFTFLGVCRSLWSWITLGNVSFTGVGTNVKFYLEQGGAYNDITPIRVSTAAGDVTFAATTGSTVLTVTDVNHGTTVGSFVTFSGAVSLGGDITATVLNREYEVDSVVDGDTYTVITSVAANASDTGDGGAAVVGAYQINVGGAFAIPLTGWGGGTWGGGTWGNGLVSTNPLRLWSQQNFGEDLIFGLRGGAIYYWDATSGVNTRAVLLSSLGGADEVPTVQNQILVSDISRFVFAFGANEIGSAFIDPMLIRWSDQENAVNWNPSSTNQAGSLQLSRGTRIVSAQQARQEILVWTDGAVYSLQYVGPPIVWGAQLVGENISIASPNAVAFAGGVAFWMGKDKFYRYDGRVEPLLCDVKRHVFDNINRLQYDQIFAGTNEEFHEVWWFYCTADNVAIDRYVVYNYVENIWYYGTMARTAWLDSGLRDRSLGATYSGNLVDHEVGQDDVEGLNPQPIHAYITSAQFAIDDGDRFAFIWRMLPDITFNGSTATNPSVTMSILPLANSGAGYNNPTSEGGVNSGAVTRAVTVPVEQFTQQLNIRVRGRQMALKIDSTAEGVAWQLGVPRIDMRPDGRR
jgi:hypothetical protein